ncbi:myristoyl transferase [Mesorhizobium sp. 113-3-9]|uniref:ABC transporter substrate-binding protein n=1 Tax=Mesorhizobium sp. 113-3-9 TaxID=2744517 RepID=UPI00193752F6|nr:ABC transporter substrate-binding protein [Mesorhizobium sp. 113-3-9]BCG86826.1 myristoyl transferase [Mesorhizobium sp. 113-3-9]
MIDLDRRKAIKLAASMLAGAMIFASPVYAQEAKKVTVALDWTPNTNHIGLYVAREKGFYKEAGLDVEILPYSDTAAGTLVSNHQADFGVAGVGFYTQHAAGADLKAVYAVVQHETGRVVFNADRADIKSPRDLDGKTYGGFGSAWENALIGSIIKADGGKGDIKTVTLGTSAYEALANGSVDFTLEVVTWEGVQAELLGQKLTTFKYSDYGVPEQHTTLLVSSDAYLKQSPDAAKAFLAATQKGYAYAVDHPDEAADLLIAANPDALTNKDLVHASVKSLVEGHYLRGENGAVGTIDPAKNAAIGDYLFANGILKDGNGAALTEKPDFAGYISNDYLPKN